jgi:hypothetical protein
MTICNAKISINFTGVSDWVKGLGVALGAVAAVAGTYYLFKATKEEDEEVTSSVNLYREIAHSSYVPPVSMSISPPVSTSFSPPVSTSILQESVVSGDRSEQFDQIFLEMSKSKASSQGYRGFHQNDSSIIVMTVDAAPSKCGGILRLPGHNRLYYYSVDWTHIFDFPNEPSKQESDKFESLNALIATLAFKKVIEIYKDSYSSILLQTDNSFASIKPGRKHKDPLNQAVMEQIDTEMKLLGIPYEWKRVKKSEDSDMWNANQLSRKSYQSPFTELDYKHYREKIDIGVDVLNIELPLVKSKVPSRFHRK